MASLSEKLRRERELRGISLKQISEDTKIGVRFLQALEEDKLELIPGEFYRRSYLRAYARYLGLVEDRAVNAYAFSNQEKQHEGSAGSESTRVAMPTWLPWVLVVAVLAVVATLLALTQSSSSPRPVPELNSQAPDPPRSAQAASATPGLSAVGEPGAEGASARSTTPSSPPVAAPPASSPIPLRPNPSAMVPTLTPARTADTPASDGALRLVVAVLDSCWLEIEADGTVVTTGLKEVGFRQEFTAVDEVRLWLGNAGGVSFWINDRPLRSLGRAGQVRKDLSITRDNFMDYVRREPSS